MLKSEYIEHIIIAALMSEGEINKATNELQIPYNHKRLQYISQLITDHNLSGMIRIESKRSQLVIHSCNEILNCYYNDWYINNTKVFRRILDPRIITYQSIIFAIILFGSRKLEYITIPTTINKEYIRTLIFCIYDHLQVPIVPAANQIKIANVPELFLSATEKISLLDGIELSDFLTAKEKNSLVRVEKR